jgi:beta-glucosidase
MPEVAELADAILFVWYPGQEGGNALGDVLFGDINPSGRLPITFPKSVDQLPPYEDYSMKERTYRYMTQDPLFPFGYGLSYTTFGYQDARLESTSIKRGQPLRVELKVENKGDCQGEEVVQFYLSKPGAGSEGPLSSLIGIKRVKLEPGQSQLVEFEISPEAMASINEQGKKQLLKGDYTLIVSAAAPVKRSAELNVNNRVDLNFRLK